MIQKLILKMHNGVEFMLSYPDEASAQGGLKVISDAMASDGHVYIPSVASCRSKDILIAWLRVPEEAVSAQAQEKDDSLFDRIFGRSRFSEPKATAP